MTKASGDYVIAEFKGIPVNELNGNVSTYSAPCGTNCVNEFSFVGSSTGIVSNENIDWINGNGTVSDTSQYTYNINSNVFTGNINCQCNAGPLSSGNLHNCQVSTVSPTSITIRTIRTITSTGVTGITPIIHTVSCQKSSTDYQISRSITGSFKALDVVYARATVTSGTQTIASTATDTIIYNNEASDTHNWYNPATGKFTVGQGGAGYYFVNCQVYTLWAFDINEYSRLIMYIGGSVFYDYYRYPSTITGQDTRSQSGIAYVGEGGEIYCNYTHNSGSTQTIGSSSANQITITRIPGQ
jgi:hypothetical protein